MRWFGLLVLLSMACATSPLLGQSAETWSKATTEDLITAREEARTRLEPLARSEESDARHWVTALEKRIELLGTLIETREASASLRSLEDVESRAKTAAAELEAERQRQPPGPGRELRRARTQHHARHQRRDRAYRSARAPPRTWAARLHRNNRRADAGPAPALSSVPSRRR